MPDTNKAEELARAFVGIDIVEKKHLLADLEILGEDKIRSHTMAVRGGINTRLIRHSDNSVNYVETTEDTINIEVVSVDKLLADTRIHPKARKQLILKLQLKDIPPVKPSGKYKDFNKPTGAREAINKWRGSKTESTSWHWKP